MQTQSTTQTRFDQLEQLRNKLRPTKSYQTQTPPTPSVSVIETQLNDHEIKMTFFYKATKADIKNAHHATKLLEQNLRAGIKHRQAHYVHNANLKNLVELNATEYNDAEINAETATHSKNIEQLKHESEVEHELGTN